MIINPLIYSGMDHFWLKQPRESIEFRSRFFTRNYLTVWIQWIFVVTLHHPKTWNKNLIKLVRSGRSSEYIFSSVLRLVISFFFSFSIPHDLILFFSLIHFLNNLPFLILNISLGKIASSSQLHPPHVPVLKALLYATAFANLYFHPTLFSPSTNSFTDTHISSSFQGSDVFCSGNVKFMHRL